MNAIWGRTMAGACAVLLLGMTASGAQAPPDQQPPAQAASGQATQQLTPAQLDQLLAPIALYPDPLLAEILMASTYPLEVVEAERWLQDPGNAALTGDALASALEGQAWDPSVKSLVPYPQILGLLDGRLDWTERLGEAFLADQAAVMDSLQRLRQRAQAAGKLSSPPQQVVTDQDQAITIEPANPNVVYVPVYQPVLAFAPWPYPDYPPYYFPDYFDVAVVGRFGFGWYGWPIFVPFWGWSNWDWHHHGIGLNPERFAGLNHHYPPLGRGHWVHDPYHRHGVPYRDPVNRARFPRSPAVSEPPRVLRGYPTGPAEPFHPGPPVQRQIEPPINRSPAQRVPPAFESFGSGAAARTQAERGFSSQHAAPSVQPHFAPSTSPGGHR
jgi:hypothetical protein